MQMRRSPGAGGVGLLDGDLLDARLVDAVDGVVPQLTHQLDGRTHRQTDRQTDVWALHTVHATYIL